VEAKTSKREWDSIKKQGHLLMTLAKELVTNKKKESSVYLSQRVFAPALLSLAKSKKFRLTMMRFLSYTRDILIRRLCVLKSDFIFPSTNSR
jgi:hypothetical protein